MRILELSPAAKRKVAKIVAHAKKRKNWYRPNAVGWMSKIPGHDKRHQCKLNTFRCVFSYSVDMANNRVVRHLSISVPSEKYPNTVAVIEIAKMFGFTGAGEAMGEKFPDDWIVHLKADEPIDDHCIVVGQDTGIQIVRTPPSQEVD